MISLSRDTTYKMESIQQGEYYGIMNKKVKELFKSLSGSEICGILSILFFLLSYLYNYNKGWGFLAFIFLLISNVTHGK